jgi:hypothetical protein
MTTKLLIATAILGAAFTASTPALAAPATDQYDKCYNNVNGVAGAFGARSCAASVLNANGGSTASNIGNGYNAPSNYQQGNGVSSTSSADEGWTNASQSFGGNTTMRASSSLTDGALHVAGVTGSDGQGFGLARISDIVTFSNSSGGVLNLTLGYTFDGQFINPQNNYFDYMSIYLHLGSPSRNILFANTSQELTGFGQVNAWGNGYFTNEWLNAGSATGFASSTFGDPASGPFGGSMFTTIAIPTGTSQLGFAFTLDVGCRVSNSACDFGNTGTFSFGDLPTGLSWTSDSGTLFSALAAPPVPGGAVPEPATWAMMILGFGLIGSAMRSRTKAAKRISFV